MVAFSADTDYVLCPAIQDGTTLGSIFKVLDGSPVLKFGSQPSDHHITTVDWTTSSNACLVGSADGSVKVTSLIKV